LQWDRGSLIGDRGRPGESPGVLFANATGLYATGLYAGASTKDWKPPLLWMFFLPLDGPTAMAGDTRKLDIAPTRTSPNWHTVSTTAPVSRLGSAHSGFSRNALHSRPYLISATASETLLGALRGRGRYRLATGTQKSFMALYLVQNRSVFLLSPAGAAERLPRLGAILTARLGQTHLLKPRPLMGLGSACPVKPSMDPPYRDVKGMGTGRERYIQRIVIFHGLLHCNSLTRIPNTLASRDR
jgi:hypothetical protein